MISVGGNSCADWNILGGERAKGWQLRAVGNVFLYEKFRFRADACDGVELQVRQSGRCEVAGCDGGEARRGGHDEGDVIPT